MASTRRLRPLKAGTLIAAQAASGEQSVQGEVERRVRRRIRIGQRLETPVRGKTFTVANMTSDALVLDLAEKWRTPIPWACLEGVVPFISPRGRVAIGSKYETEGVAGTLDAYLKGCVKRATAGWVAAVLEAAGVVEIDRRRPATVRLLSDFPWSR
jgi:hypothetical protein